MSELRQPRMIFSLAIVAAGLLLIAWSMWSKLTGAPEWRPGAHTDSLLLVSMMTTTTASGACLIPAPDASVAIPTWRKALGIVLMGASVVCFVWIVARMG